MDTDGVLSPIVFYTLPLASFLQPSGSLVVVRLLPTFLWLDTSTSWLLWSVAR